MRKKDLDKVLQETRKKFKIKAPEELKPLEDVIMIVDDDRTLIQSLEFIFKDKYKVISCYSGTEAVNKYKKQKSNISTILLDIKMDIKNGIDVYKEIKEINPAIPIIFNTAYPGEYKPLDLVQTLHPFAYIIKGTDPSILHDNISSAVKYYKLINEKDILNIKLKNIISDLKNLHKASREIASILNKDKLLKKVCRQLPKISHLKYVLCFSYNNYQWDLIHTNSIKDKKTKEALIEISTNLISTVEKSKEIIILNDISKNNKIKAILDKNSFLRLITNISVMPFSINKKLTNIVIIINDEPDGMLIDTGIFLIKTLFIQISIAINNIDMIEERINNKVLSTVGKMAGMIIHDINNPLTVIKNYIDLVRMGDDDEMKNYAKIMSSELNRLMDMLDELIIFMKKGSEKLNLSRQKISNIITDHCEKTRKTFLKNKIKIDLRLNYNGSIMIDKNKFIRVLQNLLNNAGDAIKKNGKIIITTKKNNNYVNIQISDTGKGMDKETEKKIFKPFFSGEKKRGFGLGMYIVKQIISQHNGVIKIVSTSNKGTTFSVKLPL